VIVGYCRVSTKHSEQDASIQGQEQQLAAYGCHVILKERQSAYKTTVRRKEWDKLVALVQSGRVTKVVVVNLARASRQGEDKTLAKLCKTLGVEFIALDGTPTDTSTPAGLLTVSVLSAVNEVESLVKSIAVKNGVARRRAQGATCVGKCPFGYRYNGTRPEPDPVQWDQARQLWERLAAAEFSPTPVIRQFGYQWSAVGLLRWIKNPMLRGWVYGEPGGVDALVSEEEYATAKRMIDRRSFAHSRQPRSVCLFSGLVVCERCDRPLNYTKTSGKRRLKCFRPGCEWYGRGLAEWKIRAQVVEALRQGAELIKQALPQPVAAGPVSAENLELQGQLGQLLLLQGQGVDGLDASIAALRLRLAPSDPVKAADWSAFAPIILAPGLLDAATDEDLREVLLELVEEMVYIGSPDTIRITLRDAAGSDA
jgi:DNA invertase Pin-like site-specific DNA recombinase